MRPRSVEDFVATVRAKLIEFGSLPDSLAVGRGYIRGTAFFPGGDGLVRPRTAEGFPDVLIVGHDFGTLGYFDSCVVAGQERIAQPTWRGILSRLGAADIDPQRCFFTNAFVGFRISGRNTDAFPARSDREYVQRCRDFLAWQIQIVRPRAVVALGKHVPSFLAAISRDLPWAAARDFAQIDGAGPLVAGARFGGHHASVCALVHPSYGHLNVVRRRYRGSDGTEYSGVAAEIAMLLDVIS
ncbi:MAG: hypothetical protein JWM87_1185 [Candidatus Eremiobacteraeota bacterium]|nr:hypothetical protein [Candidatus Eremiobacteraeota bacterium]